MAFQLKPRESVRQGIQRIVRDELEGALQELQDASSSDESVHGARKRFKRLRAVVRLVRDSLGEERYRAENSSFRDAARPLTEVRDAKVLIDALAGLDATFPGQISQDALAAVRKGLERHREQIRTQVLEQEHADSTAAHNVEDALAHLSDCDFEGLNWRMMRHGIKRAYKKSQRAYEAAAAEPSTANYHEWRKQAKYFLYQIEVVERMRPKAMKKLAGRTHQLTQLLGDDHDLAILEETLAADANAYGGPTALEALMPFLERRRKELERDAVLIQQRIFAKKPKTFIGRIDRYWKTW